MGTKGVNNPEASELIIDGELVSVEVDPAEFAGRGEIGENLPGRIGGCCGPADATSDPTPCIDWSEDPNHTKSHPAEEPQKW